MPLASRSLVIWRNGVVFSAQVGEVGDAPFVIGDLDDVGGEAAGAAGVEEDGWGGGGDEPAGGVEGGGTYGEAEAFKGGGQVDEAVLLEGADPFGVVGEGGVDATVAFGGAGDALVRGDDRAGAVFGEAHGAVVDGPVFS